MPAYRVFEELDEEAARALEDAVVICGQGNGSELVAQELEELGKSVRSLEGGTDAWNRLLVPFEIAGLPTPVRVWQFQRPAKACLSYVVGVPGKRCIIVDPTRQPQPYLDLAAGHGMTVSHVVDVHVHADHISGGPALSAELGVEYHLPPEDCAGVVPFPDRPLRNGTVPGLGSAEVRVMSLDLPGHARAPSPFWSATRSSWSATPSSSADWAVPTSPGTPRSSLNLFRSVHQQLRPLDPRTIIAPAHWSSPTEINAEGLVITTLEDVFTATLLNENAMEKLVEAIVTSRPAAPDAYDTIRLVNAGKVAPPEDEIDILDVGRYQCAASTSLA